MQFKTRNRLAHAAALAAIVLLPACSAADENAANGGDGTLQEDTTRTLVASLGDLPDLATLNGAISSAELGTVFDGPASYTLLAPNNAAFEKLGEEGKTLLTEEQRPVLVGLLREHILPGHMTPENIDKAIADKGGPVTMTTLGGGNVTFSKEGDVVMVDNGAGSKASFSGSASASSNGVIIPLDTVLVPEKQAE
jgi:uncharacterized surface protein with fasciclin (FAS1) repeats